jgi:predicted O-methyltransferase YrrM
MISPVRASDPIRQMANPFVRGSPPVGRLLMGVALPRVWRLNGGAAGGLGRALTTTALGRIPPDERAWIERIEERRAELASDQRSSGPGLPPDAGLVPGTLWGESHTAPVAGTSQLISLPAFWGVFLMRLVRETAPRNCLELGTGFGISAAYQAAALDLNGKGMLVTLDAAADWARIAEQGFSRLGLERAEVLVGQLDQTLDGILERMAPVDCVFLDAEHVEEPTLEQFITVLPHMSPGGLILLDDINFNWGMRRVWRAVRRETRVSLAFNLGRMGVAVVSEPDP